MDVELCLSQARLPLPAGCVLYDVHAHLSWPDFDADLDAVMQRAKAIGVDGIAVLSMDATEQQRINDICDRYDICHPGFGFHPKHVSATSAAESTIALAAVLKCYPSSRACCVGEIGLDSSPRVLEASGLPHEEVKEIQRRVLEEEIALACLLTPPLTLNVHSRGAGHHTITFIASCLAAIADQSKRPCVLMHAFDGKCDYAVKAVEEHGFCFSVAPSVVRDIQLQKLVLALPLANLLLESDSPSLGPVKNERNEPANVVISLHAIAQLKKLDVKVVADQIARTTRRLFPKFVRQQQQSSSTPTSSSTI